MPYLIELLEADQKKIYELKPGITKIGRQLDNQIVIHDSLISRYHSKILVTSDQTIIQDCQSRNHTFVNQVQITRAVLQEGDRITIGNKNFQYTTTRNTEPSTIVLEPALQTNKEFEFTPVTTKEVEFTPSAPKSDPPSILTTVRKSFNLQEGDRLLDKILDKIVEPQSSDLSVIKVEPKNNKDRALEKLKLLLEVSQQLCSPQEPQHMLSQILELLFKVMDIDRAAILSVEEESQTLECKATRLRDGLESTGSIYSSNIVDLVWQTGDTFVSADIPRDERFNESDSIIGSSIHASICVPLKVNEDNIGVLYVDNFSMPSAYSDEDVEFLAGLAAISATAIHMAKTFNKREQQLKQQISELQIIIDPERRKRESEEAIGGLNLAHFQEVAKNFRTTN